MYTKRPKSGGTSLLSLVLFQLLIVVFMIVCWVVNLVKLTDCDFEDKSWKREIIHGVGLLGPAAMITVWFD